MTAARTRALQRLGRLIVIQKIESDTGYESSATYENPGPVIELTIARYFTTPTGNGVLSHDAPLWP